MLFGPSVLYPLWRCIRRAIRLAYPTRTALRTARKLLRSTSRPRLCVSLALDDKWRTSVTTIVPRHTFGWAGVFAKEGATVWADNVHKLLPNVASEPQASDIQAQLLRPFRRVPA